MSLARALLTALSLVLAGQALAQDRHPLEPLDVSSPRATYESFVSAMREIEDAYLSYRAAKSVDGAGDIRASLLRARALFDLSEVPPATRAEVGSASVGYLFDVLLRLPPVDPATIPAGDDAPAAWQYPDTEITIHLVEEGERAGDYLFSPDTVARLPLFHELIIDLEPVRPTAYSNWRAEQVGFTGPLFPYDLVEALPDSFEATVLGTPVWKGAVVILVWAGLLLVVLAWWRAVHRWGEAMQAHWRLAIKLTVPAILCLSALAMRSAFLPQINLSGRFAEAVHIWDSVALTAGLAWAAWLAVYLVVEAIIASPAIREDSYDAHLLYLLARVGAFVAAAAVLVAGASDLGIPALGLVAGLSVGGLAFALAAQSTVENLFGGVSIFADRPFRIGDFIQYGGMSGTVERIGPRSSRIRGLDGSLTTVPNADLAKLHVTNYAAREKCLFSHVVGLSYKTTPADLEALLAQLRDHVAAHPMVETGPGMPRVHVIALGPSSIDVEIRATVATADYGAFLRAQEDLILGVMRLVEGSRAALALPSQTVYLGRDGKTGAAGRPDSESGDARGGPPSASGEPDGAPDTSASLKA
jgi:MscS family membrane protein